MAKSTDKAGSEPNDADLIAATANGDADAFETLIRKYERRVLSTAFRYLGETTAAENAAQEIFLKVWRNAKRFRGKSSFSTWLYRIAVNHCINAKAKRRKTVPISEAIGEEGPNVEERYEKERTIRAVREAVDGLPTKQRMALVLSKFDGRSYKEIAEVMGVSLSSIEALIYRAKRNLRRKLAPLTERNAL
ncbi:MAG: sigma-70 family RNA polymerase sigma factor [Candidatus Coatesbacteria bacterium]|nr:MAG: sigma-70 family RNA polymerase sigma factor [Candidatus Coatesbacteria bacterium]